jgi:hypothetical protein
MKTGPRKKVEKVDACVVCGKPIGARLRVLCGDLWCRSEYRRLYCNSWNAAKGAKSQKGTQMLPYKVGKAVTHGP